jgi:hypothetical protein
MAKNEVHVFPQGSDNRLELYHEGTHIGEYERSKDKHVDAKIEEAEGATELLLNAYRRHAGKITVRFSGEKGVAFHERKQIRPYPGKPGKVLDVIPREYWTKRTS